MEYNGVINLMENISREQRNVIKSFNIQGMNRTADIINAYRSKLLSKHQPMKVNLIVDDMSKRIFVEYHAKGVADNISHKLLMEYSKALSASMVYSKLYPETEMTRAIQKSLVNSELLSCIYIVRKTLDRPRIEASDMAYMKVTPFLKMVKEQAELPQGILSSVQGLNKYAALRMANIKDISFHVKRRKFYDEKNDTVTANVAEMNMICSGAGMLEAVSPEVDFITEQELMNFMNFLAAKPMLAFKDPIGMKIYEVIKSTTDLIDFDKDFYYHSRIHKKDEAPYVWDLMQKAPAGMPGAGRFNHVGQAHFYYADTQKGAETEVSKHMSAYDRENCVIQTMSLTPRQNIRMIDLSGDFRKGYRKFLKYIRFSLGEDNSKTPRVYLIPSFVSDCCRDCGIQGIKYFGSSEYSNYVCWEDGYFEFVTNC